MRLLSLCFGTSWKTMSRKTTWCSGSKSYSFDFLNLIQSFNFCDISVQDLGDFNIRKICDLQLFVNTGG